MKQTAVEWLEDQLENVAITDYTFAKAHKVITLDIQTLNWLIEVAKATEKEQIIESYRDGRVDQQSDKYNGTYNRKAIEYYNQTFKSE